MSSRMERAQRFALIWYQSRTDAGYTQEAMAMELGVSKKTIQNWEKGITAPDMFQAEEWFRILAVNPMKYYYKYRHPLLFPETTNDESEYADMLHEYVNQASDENRIKMLWLVSERKDYVWPPMLHMMTMHSLLSLEARTITAGSILKLYEIERDSKKISVPDEIAPNTEILREAIKRAEEAAKAGRETIYRK